MYHPTNKGFFPLLALRVEQSLSIEEKFEFDSKKSLPEKLTYINSLPRLNGDDPTFNVFRFLRISSSSWIVLTFKVLKDLKFKLKSFQVFQSFDISSWYVFNFFISDITSNRMAYRHGHFYNDINKIWNFWHVEKAEPVKKHFSEIFLQICENLENI